MSKQRLVNSHSQLLDDCWLVWVHLLPFWHVFFPVPQGCPTKATLLHKDCHFGHRWPAKLLLVLSYMLSIILTYAHIDIPRYVHTSIHTNSQLCFRPCSFLDKSSPTQFLIFFLSFFDDSFHQDCSAPLIPHSNYFAFSINSIDFSLPPYIWFVSFPDFLSGDWVPVFILTLHVPLGPPRFIS